MIDSPTEVTHNPLPKEEEIQWILNEVEHYLSPGKFHILCLFWFHFHHCVLVAKHFQL